MGVFKDLRKSVGEWGKSHLGKGGHKASPTRSGTTSASASSSSVHQAPVITPSDKKAAPEIISTPPEAHGASNFTSPALAREGSSGIAQVDATRGNAMSEIPHFPSQAVSERSPYVNVDGGRGYEIDKLELNSEHEPHPESAHTSSPITENGSLAGMGGQFTESAEVSQLSTQNGEAPPPSPWRWHRDESVTLSTVRQKLENAQVESVLRGGKDCFVPYPDLLDILDQEVVYTLLVERFNTLRSSSAGTTSQYLRHSDQALRNFASIICPGFVRPDNQAYYRAFATAASLEKPELILDLIEKEINDSHLPLFATGSPKRLCIRTAAAEDEEENPEHTVYRDCCLEWTPRDITKFERYQDHFTAPFFSRRIENGKERISHYHLWPRVTLPFVRADDLPAPLGSGGHGEVVKCKLHEAQHRLPTYTTEDQDAPQLVAVKMLKHNVQRATFDTESYILARLTQSVTEGTPGYAHIAKILVTFDIPRSLSQPEYYLVFPLADANMETFMKSNPGAFSTAPMAEKTEWVARQCWGLAEALYAFHKSPYKRESDLDPRTDGLHCDLKPGNILWYQNWHTERSRLGVLQITDFGLASYHHPESASLVEQGVKALTYRPPEPELNMTSGPSFDIWGLGCLYLELLVWLLQGYDELVQFRKKRTHTNRLPIQVDTFYHIREANGQVEVGITEEVYQKVRELHAHPQATQFVHDLLDLVINQMLVVINRQKPTDVGDEKLVPTTSATTFKLPPAAAAIPNTKPAAPRASTSSNDTCRSEPPKPLSIVTSDHFVFPGFSLRKSFSSLKSFKSSSSPTGAKANTKSPVRPLPTTTPAAPDAGPDAAAPRAITTDDSRRRIGSEQLAVATRAIFNRAGFDRPAPWTDEQTPAYERYLTVVQTTFTQIKLDVRKKRGESRTRDGGGRT